MQRELAAWLPSSTPALNRAIVKRALCDVGICEIPPGSNRSGRIDEYVKAVGSPLGSYWCAAFVAAVWREAGAETPPRDAASCDAWKRWAFETSRFDSKPVLGAVVLYGTHDDASHCGIIVRLAPLTLTVEGNTSLGGYSRNGVAVDLKEMNGPRVLGFVHPIPPTS